MHEPSLQETELSEGGVLIRSGAPHTAAGYRDRLGPGAQLATSEILVLL